MFPRTFINKHNNNNHHNTDNNKTDNNNINININNNSNNNDDDIDDNNDYNNDGTDVLWMSSGRIRMSIRTSMHRAKVRLRRKVPMLRFIRRTQLSGTFGSQAQSQSLSVGANYPGRKRSCLSGKNISLLNGFKHNYGLFSQSRRNDFLTNLNS